MWSRATGIWRAATAAGVAVPLVLAHVPGNTESGELRASAAVSASRSAGAPGAGDPYFPLDGNGGIDVRSYDIHDRYDFDSGELSGWTRLRLTGTRAVSSFSLDFLLPVRQVRIDGRRVAFRQRPHELVIDRALDARETVVVRVSYAGHPARAGYQGEKTWNATKTEVVTNGEPHMAPRWFLADSAGAHGTTRAFEALAEKVSGADLDGFFDAWLHTAGRPADTVDNGLGPRP